MGGIHKYSENCGCCSCSAHRGEGSGISGTRYIDGRSLKKYFCLGCGKGIGWYAGYYGTGKCGSCRQVGKKLTEEHKRKIGQNNMAGQFKKGHTINIGRPTWNKGKTYQISDEVRMRNKGASHYFPKGELHPNWKNGSSALQKIIRTTEQFNRWRKNVYARDGYRCIECQSNKYIEAHHIKPFHVILEEYQIKSLEDAYNCVELWDINNGETRCKECHKIITVGQQKN